MANGQRVGYIRVSSVGQNPERQLDGVKVDTLFTDTVSGARTTRPQLQALLAFVRQGDTVIVHSMDRLARNLDDLRRLVRELTDRGVAVQFLKEQLTFTGEHSPMATLLLSVLGAFAEFERALIRERQAEGIALAKARGAYKGRTRSLTTGQVEALRARAAAGEVKASLAREFGISRQTLYQYLRPPEPVEPPGQDESMADDVAPTARSIQDVYQLRAVIGGISPLIWRRLLVPAQTPRPTLSSRSGPAPVIPSALRRADQTGQQVVRPDGVDCRRFDRAVRCAGQESVERLRLGWSGGAVAPAGCSVRRSPWSAARRGLQCHGVLEPLAAGCPGPPSQAQTVAAGGDHHGGTVLGPGARRRQLAERSRLTGEQPPVSSRRRGGSTPRCRAGQGPLPGPSTGLGPRYPLDALAVSRRPTQPQGQPSFDRVRAVAHKIAYARVSTADQNPVYSSTR